MTPVKLISLAGIFAICILAYNNCAKDQFQPLASLSGANSSSSQCRAKITAAARENGLPIAPPGACEITGNYHCDLRRFRMAQAHSRLEITHCQNHSGVQQECIPVTVYSYDTSLQQAHSEDPQETAEGGAYNRDEATCINTKITSQQVALIQTEAATVDEALAKAVSQCKQWSVQ